MGAKRLGGLSELGQYEIHPVLQRSAPPDQSKAVLISRDHKKSVPTSEKGTFLSPACVIRHMMGRINWKTNFDIQIRTS